MLYLIWFWLNILRLWSCLFEDFFQKSWYLLSFLIKNPQKISRLNDLEHWRQIDWKFHLQYICLEHFKRFRQWAWQPVLTLVNLCNNLGVHCTHIRCHGSTKIYPNLFFSFRVSSEQKPSRIINDELPPFRDWKNQKQQILCPCPFNQVFSRRLWLAVAQKDSTG